MRFALPLLIFWVQVLLGPAFAHGLPADSGPYDGFTRRQTKTEDGVTTFFRYDGETSFQELSGGSPEVLAEFVRGNELGGGIAGILYREEPAEGTAREVFAYNPVGHAMALADAGGQITAGRVYAAFGQELGASGASGNNRWSNTKEHDVTGLVHHGYRAYDPETGRYLQRDPLGYADGPNVYVYAHNNPVMNVDPDGREAITVATLAVVGGYVLKQAALSEVETGLEYGSSRALGDNSFHAGEVYFRNFAVNSLVGLIPGATEAKVGVKVAAYGGKLALRTAADTAYMQTLGGSQNSVGQDIALSAVGNLAGDAVGNVAGRGWNRVRGRFGANRAMAPKTRVRNGVRQQLRPSRGGLGPNRWQNSPHLGTRAKRFFYDNRPWSQVSRERWVVRGGVNGGSFEHFFLRQKYFDNSVSSFARGFGNSGLNSGLIIPRRLNSVLGNSTSKRWAFRGAVLGGAGIVGYGGYYAADNYVNPMIYGDDE